MRVTFMNQLAFAGPDRGDAICFKHPYRVNVEMFIRYNKHQEQNWELMFRAHNFGGVPQQVRAALSREFRKYIRQRVKRNIASLRYDDFIAMANAVSIAG